MKKLLIANRGEIATRVMRAAAELGIRTVAVFSEDDARSLHRRRADEAYALRGIGPKAYLDHEQLLAVAEEHGCDAVHPGYGFLSESSAFAASVTARKIVFVGPSPETLALLGDKTRARELAASRDVAVLRGSAAVGVEEARTFFASLPKGAAMMIKAVAGGGGRGMRLVRRVEEIEEAYARCRSEAQSAFGDGRLYAEEFMPRARHVEVQIVGDASGKVIHLGERDCSLQRRHQKLIEISPCPGLSASLRARIVVDAVRLAEASGYSNAGTFEFLIGGEVGDDRAPYAFIEANPRLQVEHTVTEEVTGIDLVRLQLELAAGRSLSELGLLQKDVASPRGFAIQARINTETMGPDGIARPASGVVSRFELPSGPGVRNDTCGFVGYETNSNFDSLLDKLVVHSSSPRFSDAVVRLRRALDETEIRGVRTNVPLLRRLLHHPDFLAERFHVRFVDEHIGDLAVDESESSAAAEAIETERTLAGARLGTDDPLAVLAYGKADVGSADFSQSELEVEGHVTLRAPMQGTIVSLDVEEGDSVRRGQAVLILNAMKMEHVVESAANGIVRRVAVAAGDTVFEGRALLVIEVSEVALADAEVAASVDLDVARADLAEVQRRHAMTFDAARPDAVARRRKTGQRTARENIDDLCHPGSFVEYGSMAIAAQRQRRTVEDLIERTPADGLIAGVGCVNREQFGEERSRCAVLSYDYTVLAGTQGFQNHRKKDRMFELVEKLRLPLVFFTEGGGGRPGDTDAPFVASLDCMAFHLFAGLSGLVPLVGINSGRCFAGNAALLGCCDVVIATANSNIGMGGPAMIEGGGLGVFRPEEVGPMRVQVPNGVVDVAVADEAEAVRVAKTYLSYFQGTLASWECADQRLLRAAVPENRLRVYDVRSVIETMADAGSVLEVRRHFGVGMITVFMRIEGRPLGVVANNPKHLSGAIDSAGADKAARFMQLCDAFDIPILFLCDTPGIMVGPEVEKTALVRHCSRMFVVGSNLSVPFFTIVLRKSYGLGAQAMGGGSHKAPLFTVSWPTGEFGGMGLEGAVKLGFRKELAAIEDGEERRKLFEHMVTRAYEHGKALNTATHFEIDDVIDPADSRSWVISLLRSTPPPLPRAGKKRPCVDTW